jgi:stage V sporulation protein B
MEVGIIVSKQSFLKGTLILLAAGMINRLLGFIPRITLPRFIGAEGVGLYQMGWPFLIVLITIITGGIPIAVAKLVAEAEAEKQTYRLPIILKISLTVTFLMSCLGIITCVYGSKWIASHLLTDARASIPITYMSSMLMFIGISAVLRGYFQGKLNMIPTALSQIIETTVRIIMVLVCSFLLLPKGIEYAAGGAMLGVSIGEFAGMLLLIIVYFKSKSNGYRPLHTRRKASNYRVVWCEFKRICTISIPVTGSKLIGASSFMFESILIAQSLALAGISTSIATSQYGALQGMIIPILLLPSALTSSLSVSLIPSLSEAAARRDDQMIRYRLQQTLRISILAGAPFSLMMFLLAEPICFYLYNSIDIATMLKWMAPFALCIYIQAPMQAVLQALNQSSSALLNTFIGSILKLLLIYWLASKPELGILGAVIAMNSSIFVTTCLHGWSICRLFRIPLHIRSIGKLLICMLISGLFTYLLFEWTWTPYAFVRFCSAIVVSLALYFGLLMVFHMVPPSLYTILKKWTRNFRK